MTGRHAARTLSEGGYHAAGAGRHVPHRHRRQHAGIRPPAPAAARPWSAPVLRRRRESRLARDARRRTLAMVRVTGTASVTAWDFEGQIGATFEWDLPADYRHLVYGASEEVVRTGSEHQYRTVDRPECWGFTVEPESDDALEPRLELQEWNAPPATATSWRVSYAPGGAAARRLDARALDRIRRRRFGGDRARWATEPRADRGSPPGVGPDGLAHGRDRVHRLPGRDHARAPRTRLLTHLQRLRRGLLVEGQLEGESLAAERLADLRELHRDRARLLGRGLAAGDLAALDGGRRASTLPAAGTVTFTARPLRSAFAVAFGERDRRGRRPAWSGPGSCGVGPGGGAGGV